MVLGFMLRKMVLELGGDTNTIFGNFVVFKGFDFDDSFLLSSRLVRRFKKETIEGGAGEDIVVGLVQPESNKTYGGH